MVGVSLSKLSTWVQCPNLEWVIVFFLIYFLKKGHINSWYFFKILTHSSCSILLVAFGFSSRKSTFIWKPNQTHPCMSSWFFLFILEKGRNGWCFGKQNFQLTLSFWKQASYLDLLDRHVDLYCGCEKVVNDAVK